MTLKTLSIACGLSAAAFFSACIGGNGSVTESGFEPAKFDTIIGDKPVKLYTLTNKNGMEACVCNHGARIISLMAPDKNGALRDVVLSFDNIGQIANPNNGIAGCGATMGRYANRIANAQFKLGDSTVQLTANEGKNILHGGPDSWHTQVFDVDESLTNDTTITMTLFSADGDNGFPGNIEAKVTYTLTHDNALDIVYEATTDKETVVNMTNHSYFNLSGNPAVAGTNMLVSINADNYLPIDTTACPTGEIRAVYGNQFDFNKPKALYTCIADTSGYNGQQIKMANGYNHNFCLNTYNDEANMSKVAATLYSPESGIYMQMYTNQPGMQLYTANYLKGDQKGKRGIVYPKYAAVCFETQMYPDAPNHSDWPQPRLKPGEKYENHTVFRFSTR